MDTTELVAALLTAYNVHDAAAAAALYAPDGSHRDVAMGADQPDPEKIAGGLARLFAAFPEARWSCRSVLADGDQAAVPYSLEGRLQGRLGPYEPAGQPIRLSGVLLVEAADGTIRRTTDYWDSGTLHRQLTALPQA